MHPSLFNDFPFSYIMFVFSYGYIAPNLSTVKKNSDNTYKYSYLCIFKMKTLLSRRVETKKLSHAANMLKVIAHPLRLTIVDLLQNRGAMTVLEIQTTLSIEQAIASQHLTLMQDKGVLKSEKSGRNRYFSLAYPKMKNIIHCLEDCCNQSIA